MVPIRPGRNPGVKKEDINVTINGNQVAITAGERERQDKQGESTAFRALLRQAYRAFSLEQRRRSTAQRSTTRACGAAAAEKAAVTAKKLSIH